MNKSDTDLAIGLVQREHKIVGSAHEADAIVVNSCGVIETTERKIIKRLYVLKKSNKKIILTGCLPKINPSVIKKSMVDAVVPLRAINTALGKFNGREIEASHKSEIDRYYLPVSRPNGVIAVVPISEGCLGECTYCATKKARGRLKSRYPDFILREVRDLIKEGYKEIQLTAQDTGAYGLDIGVRLHDLLTKICGVGGDFRIRIGMMNPKNVIDILDALVDVYQNEKIYKFIHLPLQSGDDQVLKDMKRGYTVADFMNIVEVIKRKFPEMTFSTDVIVGYPTEDEEAFLKTKNLIKQIEPDILNITRFSKRPATEAAKLKDTLDRTKKNRSRELTSLHHEIGLKKNKKYKGRQLDVLITERGKNNTFLGRSNNYKQIVLKNGKIGEFYKTKIVDFTFTYLIGN